MRSIRDLVKHMPTKQSDLETHVLKYNPDIKAKVDSNPEGYLPAVKAYAGRVFEQYKPWLDGLAAKVASGTSALGHGVGHVADVSFLGNPVGALGGKFINLIAQIPDKIYGLAYGIKTGKYMSGLKNLFTGLVSYFPGATVLDQGSARIIQKDMVKDLAYKLREALDVKKAPWYRRITDKIRGSYKDVKDRADRIVGPGRIPANARPDRAYAMAH